MALDPGETRPQNEGMTEKFTGSFTQQEPISDDAIAAAVDVLRHGRLHRYNVAPTELSETALLEQEFAAQTGAKYCLAVASGGYALATALRAIGVQPGDPVLTNAFTLAPVPGAIASVGARPVFVGVNEALTIDLDDLAAKLGQARVLMLSHMRGHLCDMDRLMQMCDAAGVTVIEDCAHTMGAAWRGQKSGRQGAVGCYSCQTYKHVNSGEGGLLVTDDAELAARATILSGSYMLYERHLGRSCPRGVRAGQVYHAQCFRAHGQSARSDSAPAIARSGHTGGRWNERYRELEAGLAGTPGLRTVERPAEETYVGSSIQFLLLDWSPEDIAEVIRRCAARGVELKWFGGAEPSGFTSRYDSWRYVEAERMPDSDPDSCRNTGHARTADIFTG